MAWTEFRSIWCFDRIEMNHLVPRLYQKFKETVISVCMDLLKRSKTCTTSWITYVFDLYFFACLQLIRIAGDFVCNLDSYFQKQGLFLQSAFLDPYFQKQGDWSWFTYPVQRTYGKSVEGWSDQPPVLAFDCLIAMLINTCSVDFLVFLFQAVGVSFGIMTCMEPRLSWCGTDVPYFLSQCVTCGGCPTWHHRARASPLSNSFPGAGKLHDVNSEFTNFN